MRDKVRRIVWTQLVILERLLPSQSRENPQHESTDEIKMQNVEMDMNARTEGRTKEVKVADFTLRYGYVVQQGYYPDKPGYICQDQAVVIENFEDNPDQIFFGVFDGHGKVGCGDVVAQKTKDYLPKKLLQMRASGKYQKFGPPGDPLPDVGTSAYERAFDSVSRQILREMREKSNMAGSTAITVFMSGNAIHIANVGDSRAILGRCLERDVRLRVLLLILGLIRVLFPMCIKIDLCTYFFDFRVYVTTRNPGFRRTVYCGIELCPSETTSNLTITPQVLVTKGLLVTQTNTNMVSNWCAPLLSIYETTTFLK